MWSKARPIGSISKPALKPFGTVTAWTGKTSPRLRSPSGSRARYSPALSSSSTTPPSIRPRPCPLSWSASSRRDTPSSPSLRSSSRASAAPTTPSTTPADNARPEPGPQERHPVDDAHDTKIPPDVGDYIRGYLIAVRSYWARSLHVLAEVHEDLGHLGAGSRAGGIQSPSTWR